MEKTRKAINFDLSIKALKEFYPKHHTQAYDDIYNFLMDNGFSHEQGSGYASARSLHVKDISLLIEELGNEFPWLKDCIKKFTVTNIGKAYDFTETIQKSNSSKISLKKTTNSKEYFINKLKDFTTTKKDDEDIER